MTPKEIKELRSNLKLSQAALAERLGVARLTVLRWEAGGKKPSRLALRELGRLKVKNNGN